MTGPRVPWLALGATGTLGLGTLMAWMASQGLLALPACPSKVLLGIPCATCGGTRAAVALIEGRLGEAFHWHPAGVALLFAIPPAILWDLRRACLRRPYPALPDHLHWRLAALAAFAATWALQVARGI